MIQFLLSLWQFPQHLVGMLMLAYFLKKQRIADHQMLKYSDVYIIDRFPGGCSLGPVVFMCKNDKLMLKHELGHSVQSRILGPLYLFVIGIPSLIWASIYKDSWKKSYYWFYTEKWADILGKVNRKYYELDN